MTEPVPLRARLCASTRRGNPAAELRRVHGVAVRQLLPFVRSMPTRSDPAGREDPALGVSLLRRVEER